MEEMSSIMSEITQSIIKKLSKRKPVDVTDLDEEFVELIDTHKTDVEQLWGEFYRIALNFGTLFLTLISLFCRAYNKPKRGHVSLRQNSSNSAATSRNLPETLFRQ